jgi:hypothetical protein
MALIANTAINVANLNYNDIRAGLADFLRSKSEFVDYDFEGSTISILLDAMAYNTYVNSIYMNFMMNEGYLDTAQVRENAVSVAKLVGYTPRSTRAAKASILVDFSPSDDPKSIVVPQWTKFRSTVSGTVYTFQTIADASVPNDQGVFVKQLDVYEGTLVTQTFVVANTAQVYKLLNSNIDTNTLQVSVVPNGSTDETVYTQATDITDLTMIDTVYFLQEGFDGHYELYFGDNVLGKKLVLGDTVTLSYLSTSGKDANDLSIYTNIGWTGYNVADSLTHYVPTSVSLVRKSENGQDRETLASIKFNAPKNYESQNRTVVENDYKTYILNNYSYVQSLNVWGGEKHIPPIYGKVIISIKPTSSYSLSESRKNEIILGLKERNVMSIEPIIIDPTIIYINPIIVIIYNAQRTALSTDGLYNKLQTAVVAFETDNLSIFGNSFYHSAFTQTLLNTDASILSVDVSHVLEKRFAPILSEILSYKLAFDTALKNPYTGYLGCISSTGFKCSLSTNTVYLDDDGAGNLRLYYVTAELVKFYVSRTIGTVDYQSGLLKFGPIEISSFSGLEIRILADPEKRDYTPTKNTIILLSNPDLELTNSKSLQVVKSGILDVSGNLSPVYSNSIDVPVTL